MEYDNMICLLVNVIVISCHIHLWDFSIANHIHEYILFFFSCFHLAATAFSIKAINSTEANLDKLPNEFVKLPENLFRLNQKPCKNLSVDDYLLTKAHTRNIVNIDHLKPNVTLLESPTNSSDSHSEHVPISIDVKHDLFDAKYGLVRNVFYTGM